MLGVLRKKWVYPLLLFAFFTTVYSVTAYPGPGGRINYNDSAWKALLPVSEQVTPHVTGFPLYIWAGKVFNLCLPMLTLAGRAVAVSVFFGALAVVLLYLTALALTQSRTGAALAALILGFSHTFWTQASEAEIYSLLAYFVIQTAYLFIRYRQTGKSTFLYWGMFVYAVSFGNHLMVLWMLPALAYITWKVDRSVFVNKKFWGVSLLSLVAGLLPYGYLYFRLYPAEKPPFRQFADFVTGAEWKSMAMFIYSFSEFFEQRMALFLGLLNRQFFAPGIAAFATGLVLAFRFGKKEDRNIYLFLLFLGLLLLFFPLNYGIHDIEVYFIPVYMVMALYMALMFADPAFKRGKVVWAVAVIVLQLLLNLGKGDIVSPKNEPLNTLLFLVNNTPPGSVILIPDTFDRNGDYRQVTRYLTYSGEYGPLFVVLAEEDTRIPYSFVSPEGKRYYYLNGELERVLGKCREMGRDHFYFIGSKHRKSLERDQRFEVTGTLFGEDRWLGRAFLKPVPARPGGMENTL